MTTNVIPWPQTDAGKIVYITEDLNDLSKAYVRANDERLKKELLRDIYGELNYVNVAMDPKYRFGAMCLLKQSDPNTNFILRKDEQGSDFLDFAC